MPEKFLFVVVEPKEQQQPTKRSRRRWRRRASEPKTQNIKPQNVSELKRHYFRNRVCLFLNNPLYLHLFILVDQKLWSSFWLRVGSWLCSGSSMHLVLSCGFALSRLRFPRLLGVLLVCYAASYIIIIILCAILCHFVSFFSLPFQISICLWNGKGALLLHQFHWFFIFQSLMVHLIISYWGLRSLSWFLTFVLSFCIHVYSHIYSHSHTYAITKNNSKPHALTRSPTHSHTRF